MALQTRIKHVVVLMLENRSFDHMFGFSTAPAGQSVENLVGKNLSNLVDPTKPESATNPKIPAKKTAPFAVHDKEGPSHSFNGTNVQLCNNRSGPSAQNPVRNNGFVRNYRDHLLQGTHEVDKNKLAEVMQSFSPTQLPAINALASNFCLCDHWFCEVPGPTMPNRMYIHAATSEGYVHNAFDREFTSKTIYELFDAAGHSWATYFHDFNEVLQFKALPKTEDHFRRFDERWKTDVANGQLATYSFILPRFMNKTNAPANSQHAPHDMRFGENLIADVYDALAANQALFNETVLIVTYDECGGFYDHIAPESAPNPDGQDSPNPDDTASFQVPTFKFDRLGLRVPTLIVSPWIEKGIVEKRNLQHTSVIKTMSEMFGLAGPLNKRDKSATSFANLFTKLSAPRPATDMPKKLPRPSLANVVVSFVAGAPVDLADEPLDSLSKEWLEGTIKLAAKSPGVMALSADALAAPPPNTQGAASDFVEARLRDAFNI
jgi:phospholipase C